MAVLKERKKEWTIDFAIDFLGKNGFELISLKKKRNVRERVI